MKKILKIFEDISNGSKKISSSSATVTAASSQNET